MSFKKRWKVEYYLYNLTQRVEKRFYTILGALAHAYHANRYWECKVRVKSIEA